MSSSAGHCLSDTTDALTRSQTLWGSFRQPQRFLHGAMRRSVRRAGGTLTSWDSTSPAASSSGADRLLLRPRDPRRSARTSAKGRRRQLRLGVLPAEARIGEVRFGTSLPERRLPASTQGRRTPTDGLGAGDDVTVEVAILLE